ncbi:MAG: hypothetical protein E6776_12825, partial [Eggerthella sp.]|nr:hypothetical protein [Eggerthella sp.]
LSSFAASRVMPRKRWPVAVQRSSTTPHVGAAALVCVSQFLASVGLHAYHLVVHGTACRPGAQSTERRPLPALAALRALNQAEAG